MKVIRLDQHLFEEECKKLALLIRDSNPDMIVGIETGGVFVANEIINFLSDKVHYEKIKIQRLSSNSIKKKGFVKSAIQILPEYGVRVLRKLEMGVSEWKSKFKEPHRNVQIDLSKRGVELMKEGCKIVLIDDAIDTGKTMKLAKSYFERCNSANNILISCLTVTHRQPMVKPNFQIYQRTILQFPWSLDSKS